MPKSSRGGLTVTHDGAGKSSKFVRELNRKAIFRVLLGGTYSRTEIAEITKLTKPTVSVIVEQLIQQGLVQEIGSEKAERGRYPCMLSLRPNTYFAIGVGIYRSHCVAGITDTTGQCIDEQIVDIQDMIPILAVQKISDVILQMLVAHEIPREHILGAGISIPGPVNTVAGQVINPPNFEKWHGVYLADMFLKRLGVPVFLENDSTSYAMAENLYGEGRRFRQYFTLVLVDGVGSALLTDGVPYRGCFGFNTEIGHVSIKYDGELCACGNHGCLELYTSLPVLVEQAKRQGLPVNRWEDIVDKALSNDEVCLEIVDRLAYYLSIAIINSINIFAPEAVILAGKISYKSDILYSLIMNKIGVQTGQAQLVKPNVLMSQLDRKKESIIPAAIVLNNFYFNNVPEDEPRDT